MNRRLPGLFGLLLVVILAGCASGGSALDGGGPDSDTSPASDVGGSTTTPPVGDGGSLPGVAVDSPTGSANGIDDALGTPDAGSDDRDGSDSVATPATDTPSATAAPATGTDAPRGSVADLAGTDARATLEATGSYTSNWSFRTNRADVHEASSMAFVQWVDVDAERASTSVRIVGGEVHQLETHSANGMQYTRIWTDGDSEATYFGSEMAFDARSSPISYGFVYDYSEVEQYTYQGTGTFDGVAVSRYVFEATDSWLASEQVPEDGFEIRTASIEMLVDDAGIPRYLQYRVEGTTGDGQAAWYDFEFTVTDVGSTTVPDPDWLSSAKEFVR